MGYLLVGLMLIGIVLLVLSFFKESSMKQLENQIEGTSITTMQELYKLKKKVRLIEEELMIDNHDDDQKGDH